MFILKKTIMRFKQQNLLSTPFCILAYLLFLQITLQYQMDLLVQQKIHAAMQPLFDKIDSLEQHLKSMALQIQTLQNENQLKHSSALSNSIQIQTQQSRIEQKIGADKSKINKQAVVEKISNKKESNGAKTQLKTEMPQNNGNKKDNKKQVTKSSKINKDSKAESPLVVEKLKKSIEQKQTYKMMKQPLQDMFQNIKIEIYQQASEKMNEIKQNSQILSEKHSYEPSARENNNAMEQQEQLLITYSQNEDSNIIIMPDNIVESTASQVQNNIQVDPQSHQNQKVDIIIQKIPKEEQHNQMQSYINQNQMKIQMSPTTEIIKEMQSPPKQDQKTKVQPTRQQKALSTLFNKKEQNLHKKTDENREKMNKSTIIHKQKMQARPRKESVKEIKVKQKNLGKSVDIIAKKIKSKEQHKTQKKANELLKTEQALNEQDVKKGKHEIQQQYEENLLGQAKEDISA